MDRRVLVKGAVISIAGMAASAFLPPALAAGNSTRNPRQFGARGDGSSRDTGAVQRAIDECSRSGGGTVMVTPGTYLVGMIALRSNVTLSLQAGATLLGSTDDADYVLPVDISAALGGHGGKHLIFAYEADNIAIVGEGTIDGQAAGSLVQSSQPPQKEEDLWKDTAGSHWKQSAGGKSPMVELANCNGVRVEGVTLQNSPGWNLRPIGCDNVAIRGVRIRNPLNAQYTDGIDITSSQNVRISDCDIVTGDDAIVLKTINKYGGMKPCRNVVISNCKLSTEWAGFKIGSESAGQFSNISMSDCTIYSSSETPINERVATGIVVEMVDNGSIDGVEFSNITMHNVRAALFVRLQNSPRGDNPEMKGVLRNITLSNVRADGAILNSSITGIPSFPVQNVTLTNVDIQTTEPGKETWAQKPIDEMPNGAPKAWMFGRLPAYGLYCRHVQGLTLTNVSIKSQTRDPRPMLVCEDVQKLKITGVSGTAPAASEPFLDIRSSRDVSVQGSEAPAGTATFASITGAGSGQIAFAGNTLNRAAVSIGTDVPPGAVSGAKGPGH